MNKAQRDIFDAQHEVRNDGQAHLGPVNLDGMTESDLAIAKEHPALNEAVRRYAEIAIEARTARLEGKIRAALDLERKGDQVYANDIPQACRW